MFNILKTSNWGKEQIPLNPSKDAKQLTTLKFPIVSNKFVERNEIWKIKKGGNKIPSISMYDPQPRELKVGWSITNIVK